MSKVMVYGGGAREHALLWKLAQSPKVSHLVSVGGSPAWKATGRVPLEAWPEIPNDAGFTGLARNAKRAGVALLVVGPDQALAEGIADAFIAVQIPVFGPTSQASQIETSKSFAKKIMHDAGVPTADFVVVEDADEAKRFIRSAPWGKGWVLKADGLALGKGVIVPETQAEAIAAVPTVFRLSKKVVIEERLMGHEMSWFSLVSGTEVVSLTHARDYKRLKTGDQGPNTGGMGAVSPADHAQGLEDLVRTTVFEPVAQALHASGTPFCGVLYAGIMVGDDRIPRVLEFNARFGDPETQVVLPRLQSDLFDALFATATGNLAALPPLVFSEDYAVYVVGAAPGYPAKVVTGAPVPITIQDLSSQKPEYFVGGVSSGEKTFTVRSGRVFGGLGVARTLEGATKEAYANLKKLQFPGMQFRSDVGRT